MKILDWVQSKISGRQGKRFDAGPGSAHYTSKQDVIKEEFKDWPQTLLAIGTFGNNDSNKDPQRNLQLSESTQETSDLSIEEVIKLHKEISKLLHLKPSSSKAGVDSEVHTQNYKAGDMFSDNHNVIRQRSLSFLLEKLLGCRSGLSRRSSIWDPVPESRMDKILRKILHKKIHPQAAPRATTTTTKYLQRNTEEEKGGDGSKWDKTDSEYIVLEI